MKYKDTEYRMELNLDAVLAIEEAGMTLGDVLKGRLDMKQTVTLTCILLNAGLDKPVFTEQMIRKHVKPGALKSLYVEINGALKDGMCIETKNDKTRDIYLEEIEAKKAEA